MQILIKGGRVIDPANGIDRILDVLVSDGKISQVAEGLSAENATVIDAAGMWVVPGLIDLHVHLREPGYEYKETVLTGSMSAAAGGFTTVCCMPNTSPVTDSAEVIAQILQKQKYVNLILVGALTKGQAGKELADFSAMAKAGAGAFSEDGKSVANARLMKQAFIAAKNENLPIFSHCEDMDLVDGGVINAGKVAEKFGLNGISNSSEDVIAARDILLADETEARLHICHMSTKMSVQLLREAKARGQSVSGEATPHHFSLSEDDIAAENSNYKMNPPLRSKQDVEAVIRGLRDGTIDVIATDHAPHSAEEKSCGFVKAANGIVGLETAVALSISKLVNTGILTPGRLIEKMSANPARILGIDKGSLGVGKTADITLIDPSAEQVVEPEKFFSKGKNTPFGGMKLCGQIMYTIVNGEIVFAKEAMCQFPE